jgi:carboxyl-terminal processing protease
MPRLVALLIVFGLSIPSATLGSPQAADAHDPELNFEYVWKSMDRSYAQFGGKHVDWGMVHRMYRPQVTAATTDAALWDVLVPMLGTLNDAHVCLSDGQRRVCGGLVGDTRPDDFSPDLVKTKYLHGKSADALDGSYTYGWLTDQIGYLHIADLKDGVEPTTQAIDAFMREFVSAQALVIDVRANPGGTGRVPEIVASRFADRRRHYMQSQTRYGPKYDDFWPTEYRALGPDGPAQFTRPVVLLTHRHSGSGAEAFTMAMRVLPHVTVVGDLTEGACSAQFPDRLPNGWTLWVAFKVTRDHEGICWDGIGIPPDLRVLNTPAEIAAGTDRQLEFALRLLERGAPEPQDEAASLTGGKTSLVDEYARGVRQQQVEAAVSALSRARAAGADTAFFGADEAMQLAGQYLGRKQYPAAIGLLQACQEDFPKLAVAYAMLAQAYLGAGDVAAAEAALAQGKAVEPMFPWEAPQIERARREVRKAKLGSAARMIGQALADGGVPAAERELQELLARRDTGPVFDENDFNAVGYELLQAGEVEHAVFMLEKAVQLYPDSWNAYDSLGEALARAGQKERAIESYRKSLELNPRNQSARKKLEEMGAGRS